MVRLKSFHDNKQCAAITLDTMKQKGYTILLLKYIFFPTAEGTVGRQRKSRLHLFSDGFPVSRYVTRFSFTVTTLLHRVETVQPHSLTLDL